MDAVPSRPRVEDDEPAPLLALLDVALPDDSSVGVVLPDDSTVEGSDTESLLSMPGSDMTDSSDVGSDTEYDWESLVASCRAAECLSRMIK